MSKKIICSFFYFLLILSLTGCCSPRYNDNYPPEHIRLKYVKEGDHTSRFYKAWWDTIWTPKGDTWLQQKHLRLLRIEPKDGDWQNIHRKALLLHENAHCMNDQNYEHLKYILCNYQWFTEREGYQVSIRYLVLRGYVFGKVQIGQLVDIMSSPTYNNMASRKEIYKFILKVIGKAKIERKLSKNSIELDKISDYNNIDANEYFTKSLEVLVKIEQVRQEKLEKEK